MKGSDLYNTKYQKNVGFMIDVICVKFFVILRGLGTLWTFAYSDV